MIAASYTVVVMAPKGPPLGVNFTPTELADSCKEVLPSMMHDFEGWWAAQCVKHQVHGTTVYLVNLNQLFNEATWSEMFRY